MCAMHRPLVFLCAYYAAHLQLVGAIELRGYDLRHRSQLAVGRKPDLGPAPFVDTRGLTRKDWSEVGKALVTLLHRLGIATRTTWVHHNVTCWIVAIVCVALCCCLSGALIRRSRSKTEEEIDDPKSVLSDKGHQLEDDSKPNTLIPAATPADKGDVEPGVHPQVDSATTVCCYSPFSQDMQCSSALRRCWGDLLIKTVRRGIARYDTISIGTRVKLSGVTFNPLKGRLVAQDVIICNPEGYHSEYLAKVSRVVLDVNMRKLIVSKGEFIELDRVEFDGVHIIYEQRLSTSNLEHMMDFIQGKEAEESGYIEKIMESVTETVGGTVSRAANFVSTEARNVVTNIAPPPLRRAYSVVAGTTQEVLDGGAAVAGTAVMATSSAVSSTARAATDAGGAISEAARQAGEDVARCTAEATDAAATVAADVAETARYTAKTAGAAVGIGTPRTLTARREEEWNSSASLNAGIAPQTLLRRRTLTENQKIERRRSVKISEQEKEELAGSASSASLASERRTDEAADEWFVVHRAIIRNITVRLSSTITRGSGIDFIVPDLDWAECMEEVEADSAIDTARFLMNALLDTVNHKVSHELSFAFNMFEDGVDMLEDAVKEAVNPLGGERAAKRARL